MSNFLDEAPGFAGEFPLPAEAGPEPETLEDGERWSAKADCSDWELLDIRGNGNIGDKGKTVINIKARGLSDAYSAAGEVTYWFDPKRIDNPKDGQRRDAAAVGKFLVALGLLTEDQFTGQLTGKDICQLLVAGASKPTPRARFKASLVWNKRSYKGNDGNLYTAREVSFRSLREVEIQAAATPVVANEDLPF